VRHLSSFEQTPVASEKDAALRDGRLGQCLILPVVAIESIEAAQAQVACQPAQMYVGGKASDPQRGRPHPGRRGDIKPFEHRIDAHSVAVGDPTSKIHRFSVDQNQVDLGMRHPQAFYKVLDGAPGRADIREFPAPSLGGQEAGQFGVETDANGGRPRLLEWLALLHLQRAGQHRFQQILELALVHTGERYPDIGVAGSDDPYLVVVKKLHPVLFGVQAF